MASKVLFIWRRASPGTRAGPLCQDLTFTKNSIALLSCFIFSLYENRASPVRRDAAFAHPRSRLTGLIFLHLNSAALAGRRAGIVHNINFKRALVHSLNFEAGRRRKGSRRDKQTIASLQGTLAITKYIIFLCNYPLRYCLNSVKQNCCL